MTFVNATESISQYYFSVHICLNCYVDGAYRNELIQ